MIFLRVSLSLCLRPPLFLYLFFLVHLRSGLIRKHVAMAYTVICTSDFRVMESKVPRDRSIDNGGDEFPVLAVKVLPK